MRTTLTLDDDVGERLREAAYRERKPFRTVVNEALRLGLGLRGKAVVAAEPFEVRTFRSSFVGGIDEGRLNQLADQLEAEAFVKTRPPAESGPGR
ncbi:MAG: antitoxin [Limisphaerales bacterium]